MKALLIDDETRAAVNLQYLLNSCAPGAFPEIRLANNITAGLQLLQEMEPDVVFLDIRLRDRTGFEFLEHAGTQRFAIVFVTAYDEYAIRALRLNAFDYLLKPIDSHELSACIERLKVCCDANNTLTGAALQLVGDAAGQALKTNPDYLIIRDASGIEKISFSNIHYLEASGPYTSIVYKKNDLPAKTVKCKTLTDFEQMLPNNIFLRIHRSYLINVRNISRLLKDKGKYFVLIQDIILPVSRRRFSLLETILHHVGKS